MLSVLEAVLLKIITLSVKIPFTPDRRTMMAIFLRGLEPICLSSIAFNQ